MKNQKLFYNGNIISMDNHQEYESILIENDKIIGTGTLKEMQSLADNNAQQIDLKGKTMVPGFIDGHSHISLTAVASLYIDLSPAKNIPELLEIVQKAYDDIPEENRTPNEFLIGTRYDNSNYPNQEQPTKEMLDKISPIMPIALGNMSGHSGVYNSAALRYFGIDDNVSEKPGFVYGRYLEGPLKGKLNGFVAENAYWDLQPKTPQPSIDLCIDKLLEVQKMYLAAGITLAQDGMVSQEAFNILSAAANKKQLIIPVVGYVQQFATPTLYQSHPEYHQFNNNFKLGGLKLFIDGSPQQLTAWMTTPYLTGPANNYGTARHTQEEIYNIIKIALVDYKVPLIIHNNGDAAAQAIIDNINKVKKDYGVTDVQRTCFIHSQFMRPDQIASIANTDLKISFFVSHIYEWGDTHIKNIGMEKSNYMSACNSAVKANISFTFHDDTPVLMPNYFESMYCAVNRITKNGVQLAKEEQITPYEALKALTIYGAYQYGEEDIRGTITVNKIANLVVLDTNPLTCDPKEIRNIKVIDTYLNGDLAYHNPNFN